jgi:hypothetical protein
VGKSSRFVKMALFTSILLMTTTLFVGAAGASFNSSLLFPPSIVQNSSTTTAAPFVNFVRCGETVRAPFGQTTFAVPLVDEGSSTITVISCSMEGSIDLLSSKVAFLASSIDETTVTACTFVQHSVSSVPELIYVQAHVEEEFDADAGSSLTVGCSGGQQKTMHSYNIASLFALSS